MKKFLLLLILFPGLLWGCTKGPITKKPGPPPSKPGKYVLHSLKTPPGMVHFFKQKGSFLLVYATRDGAFLESERETARQRAAELQKKYSISMEVVADVDLKDVQAGASNLLCTGPFDGHRWLREVKSALPVQFSNRYFFELAGKKYEGPLQGVAFLTPNPANPARLLLVYSGNSFKAVEKLWKKADPERDYTAIEGDEVLVKGNFKRE